MSSHTETTAVVAVGVLSLAFWAFFAVESYRRYTAKYGEEYSSRVVSAVHAAVSVVACCISLTVDSEWNQASAPTFSQKLALIPTVTYFLVDLVGILRMSYFDIAFLAHHLVCITGLVYSMLGGVAGLEMLLCTLICEVSNPFMHVRWLMMKRREMLGISATMPSSVVSKTKRVPRWVTDSAYFVLDNTTAIVFIVARLLIGPWLTFPTVMDERNPVLIRCLAFCLQAVSFKFCYYVLKSVYSSEVWVI